MRAACDELQGEHDFAAFRAAKCGAADAVRRVTRVEVHSRPYVPSALQWDAFDGQQSVPPSLFHAIRSVRGMGQYASVSASAGSNSELDTSYPRANNLISPSSSRVRDLT